jgi:glycosyltransferase involved in cell wall biosynthesis
MEPILVSAIIPAYNAELYLAQAIESAFAQTYQNFEIIVVDDGSTDGTAQIAHQFGDTVRYVYQSNQGLAAARNTGIRHARSQIIALLDADDLWDPDFLQVMTGLLEKHPDAAAVHCGFQYIDAQGNIVGKPSLRVVSPEVFHRTQVIQGNWLSACAVLFRKPIAEEVGLFDESLRALEDQDLWIRLSASHPFIGLPVSLVKYRRHGSNMSKDPRHMITAGDKLMEKVFGPLDDNVSSWPKVKVVAYRNHFRSAAIRYLSVGNYEKCTYYLCRLAVVSLDYLCSIELWRGLALAHMPDEFQFDASVEPDWNKMQNDIDFLLAELNKQRVDDATVDQNYARIKASAFLALADEAGRRGNLRLVSRWLWIASRSFAPLWVDRRLWGTIFRSLTGKMNRTYLQG